MTGRPGESGEQSDMWLFVHKTANTNEIFIGFEVKFSLLRPFKERSRGNNYCRQTFGTIRMALFIFLLRISPVTA